MINKLNLLIVLGLTSTQALANKSVYQWTDEMGRIHFSETQPKNKLDVKEIKLQQHKEQPNNPSTPPNTKTTDNTNSIKPSNQTNENNPQQNKACANAKTNFEMLKSSAFVQDPTDPGKIMNTEKRKLHTELAEKQVATYCGAEKPSTE
jgi:hypothetical protein